jgi:hypothetical protein
VGIRSIYGYGTGFYATFHANTVVVDMRRTVSVTEATVTVRVTPAAALRPAGVKGTMASGPGAGTVRVDVGVAAGGLGIARSVELVGIKTGLELGLATGTADFTADAVAFAADCAAWVTDWVDWLADSVECVWWWCWEDSVFPPIIMGMISIWVTVWVTVDWLEVALDGPELEVRDEAT